MALRIILLGMLSLSLRAQVQIESFQYLGEDYFDNELYLGVALRNTNIAFPNAVPIENHQLSFWTGDLLLYRTNMNPGGFRYSLRNKVLGELFFAFGEYFDDIYRREGSTFSHFFIGAHTFSWNTVIRDRWALALGFNLNDLIVGSTFRVADSLGRIQDFTPAPHGCYIGAGPSLRFDYLLNRFLLLELQGDYTFHFTNAVPLTYGEDDPDHPMPHQAFLALHLMSSWGIYTGFEASFLNDRSSYNGDAAKIEWHIGFRFMM